MNWFGLIYTLAVLRWKHFPERTRDRLYSSLIRWLCDSIPGGQLWT